MSTEISLQSLQTEYSLWHFSNSQTYTTVFIRLEYWTCVSNIELVSRHCCLYASVAGPNRWLLIQRKEKRKSESMYSDVRGRKSVISAVAAVFLRFFQAGVLDSKVV